MPSQPVVLRADAARNRARLLAAAAEAFEAGGPVALDAVARRAGVGIGTLYRHFPTREDLVEEVYRDQVRPLREAATTLLSSDAPAAALRRWISVFAQWAQDRRGVSEALVAMSATGRFGTGPVCDEVQRILEELLEAGVRAGDLRGDVDALDVAGLLAGAIAVAGSTERSDHLEGMLTVVVDGLRP